MCRNCRVNGLCSVSGSTRSSLGDPPPEQQCSDPERRLRPEEPEEPLNRSLQAAATKTAHAVNTAHEQVVSVQLLAVQRDPGDGTPPDPWEPAPKSEAAQEPAGGASPAGGGSPPAAQSTSAARVQADAPPVPPVREEPQAAARIKTEATGDAERLTEPVAAGVHVVEESSFRSGVEADRRSEVNRKSPQDRESAGF